VERGDKDDTSNEDWDPEQSNTKGPEDKDNGDSNDNNDDGDDDLE
jgi:hypothetical protein